MTTDTQTKSMFVAFNERFQDGVDLLRVQNTSAPHRKAVRVMVDPKMGSKNPSVGFAVIPIGDQWHATHKRGLVTRDYAGFCFYDPVSMAIVAHLLNVQRLTINSATIVIRGATEEGLTVDLIAPPEHAFFQAQVDLPRGADMTPVNTIPVDATAAMLSSIEINGRDITALLDELTGDDHGCLYTRENHDLMIQVDTDVPIEPHHDEHRVINKCVEILNYNETLLGDVVDEFILALVSVAFNTHYVSFKGTVYFVSITPDSSRIRALQPVPQDTSATESQKQSSSTPKSFKTDIDKGLVDSAVQQLKVRYPTNISVSTLADVHSAETGALLFKVDIGAVVPPHWDRDNIIEHCIEIVALDDYFKQIGENTILAMMSVLFKSHYVRFKGVVYRVSITNEVSVIEPLAPMPANPNSKVAPHGPESRPVDSEQQVAQTVNSYPVKHVSPSTHTEPTEQVRHHADTIVRILNLAPSLVEPLPEQNAGHRFEPTQVKYLSAPLLTEMLEALSNHPAYEYALLDKDVLVARHDRDHVIKYRHPQTHTVLTVTFRHMRSYRPFYMNP